MTKHSLIAISLTITFSASAVELSKPQNIPLFMSDEIIELTVQANFPEVNEPRADQSILSPGTISYIENEEKKVLDVQFHARGNSRARYCQFAPIMLVLKKENETKETVNERLKDTIFDNAKSKMKLVTHCEGNDQYPNTNWTEVLLLEYASYRVVMESGLPALDTRLVRAKYITPKGDVFKEEYMLLLENGGDLGQRYGMEELDRDEIRRANVLIGESARFPFEFASKIGLFDDQDHGFQSDWNSIFIAPEINGEIDSSQGLQVGYDFLLWPNSYPYSVLHDSYYQMGWLKEQEDNLFTEAEKDSMREWVRIVAGNKEKMFNALNSIPFSAASIQKKNMQDNLEKIFRDVDAYLSRQ